MRHFHESHRDLIPAGYHVYLKRIIEFFELELDRFTEDSRREYVKDLMKVAGKRILAVR